MQVLVVDDDAQIRETLRFALEDEGFDVLEAADGLTALSIMRMSDTRLVTLLDLMMPRLDGAGVLGVVSADEWLARQHAIILMTATSRILPRPFANLLANLHVRTLAKPMDLDTLLRMVQEAAQHLVTPRARINSLYGVTPERIPVDEAIQGSTSA